MKLLLDLSELSIETRCDIANDLKNPNQLAKLAEDDACEVRCSVAENPHISKETFEKLCNDEEVCCSIARNPKVSQEILEKIVKRASKDDWYLRCMVAGNPNISRALFKKFSKDSNSHVRLAVAGNPSTPQEFLEDLTKDISIEVRTEAKKQLRQKNQ